MNLSFAEGHRIPIPVEIRSFPEVNADFPDFISIYGLDHRLAHPAHWVGLASVAEAYRQRVLAGFRQCLAGGTMINASIYEAVKRGDADSDRVAHATRWLAKAWFNSASISMEDRIVFLKTGFEALTGESSTAGAAEKLKKLFESLGITNASEALLWSPVEASQSIACDYDNFGTKNTATGQSDLQCWFSAFGGARNNIIHKGGASAVYNHGQGGERRGLVYRRSGSQYSGSLVLQGQRLLLESIQAKLDRMGFRAMWKSSWQRPS